MLYKRKVSLARAGHAEPVLHKKAYFTTQEIKEYKDESEKRNFLHLTCVIFQVGLLQH